MDTVESHLVVYPWAVRTDAERVPQRELQAVRPDLAAGADGDGPGGLVPGLGHVVTHGKPDVRIDGNRRSGSWYLVPSTGVVAPSSPQPRRIPRPVSPPTVHLGDAGQRRAL